MVLELMKNFLKTNEIYKDVYESQVKGDDKNEA